MMMKRLALLSAMLVAQHAMAVKVQVESESAGPLFPASAASFYPTSKCGGAGCTECCFCSKAERRQCMKMKNCKLPDMSNLPCHMMSKQTYEKDGKSITTLGWYWDSSKNTQVCGWLSGTTLYEIGLGPMGVESEMATGLDANGDAEEIAWARGTLCKISSGATVPTQWYDNTRQGLHTGTFKKTGQADLSLGYCGAEDDKLLMDTVESGGVFIIRKKADSQKVNFDLISALPPAYAGGTMEYGTFTRDAALCSTKASVSRSAGSYALPARMHFNQRSNCNWYHSAQAKKDRASFKDSSADDAKDTKIYVDGLDSGTYGNDFYAAHEECGQRCLRNAKCASYVVKRNTYHDKAESTDSICMMSEGVHLAIGCDGYGVEGAHEATANGCYTKKDGKEGYWYKPDEDYSFGATDTLEYNLFRDANNDKRWTIARYKNGAAEVKLYKANSDGDYKKAAYAADAPAQVYVHFAGDIDASTPTVSLHGNMEKVFMKDGEETGREPNYLCGTLAVLGDQQLTLPTPAPTPFVACKNYEDQTSCLGLAEDKCVWSMNDPDRWWRKGKAYTCQDKKTTPCGYTQPIADAISGNGDDSLMSKLGTLICRIEGIFRSTVMAMASFKQEKVRDSFVQTAKDGFANNMGKTAKELGINLRQVSEEDMAKTEPIPEPEEDVEDEPEANSHEEDLKAWRMKMAELAKERRR